MNKKTYQNEWKKKQRELNTPYAQRVRESKRTEKYKELRKQKRQLPDQKEKEKIYQRKYRQRVSVILKTKARYKARYALIQGIIKRPNQCHICNKPDIPLKDGRSGLRMDHYLGYEEKNWLNVKFICVSCDGRQLRNDNTDK